MEELDRTDSTSLFTRGLLSRELAANINKDASPLHSTSRSHLASELWSSLCVWKNVSPSPPGCVNDLPQKCSSGSEETGPAHPASTDSLYSLHTFLSPALTWADKDLASSQRLFLLDWQIVSAA